MTILEPTGMTCTNPVNRLGIRAFAVIRTNIYCPVEY